LFLIYHITFLEHKTTVFWTWKLIIACFKNYTDTFFRLLYFRIRFLDYHILELILDDYKILWLKVKYGFFRICLMNRYDISHSSVLSLYLHDFWVKAVQCL